MTNQHDLHISVLLEQSVDALCIVPNGTYIDATFGRGGHSKAILSKLDHHGTLLVIDQDPAAIDCAKDLYYKINHQNNTAPQFIIHHGSFADLTKIVEQYKLKNINGIFFDLGVSSPQLDNADRGFSFNKDGPLDMRMNNSDNFKIQTAEELINTISEKDLADILWKYGEEKYSRKIAKAIINARQEARIISTLQLAQIIKLAHPKWPQNKHPATQSFLALRLFINQELEAVETSLLQSLNLLEKNGRLVVISFHSLEDRIVKNFMNKYSKQNYLNNTDVLAKLVKKLPITDQELKNKNLIAPAQLKIVQKALKAGIIEGKQNIRARSAILRVAEKL